MAKSGQGKEGLGLQASKILLWLYPHFFSPSAGLEAETDRFEESVGGFEEAIFSDLADMEGAFDPMVQDGRKYFDYEDLLSVRCWNLPLPLIRYCKPQEMRRRKIVSVNPRVDMSGKANDPSAETFEWLVLSHIYGQCRKFFKVF